MDATITRNLELLESHDASTRLGAALALGSSPDPRMLDALVGRCAVEPDFHVRDMLTWALVRLPSEVTVPRLIAELHAAAAQARSQALHTLSKIGDPRAFPEITPALMRDPDDEVARSAWRAAVALVPGDLKAQLAEEFSTQLGRGDRNLQLSLSRALVTLGAQVIETVLERALGSSVPDVRAHASATLRLLNDPDSALQLNVSEARRRFVLGREPSP
jgi:HEAT repeat protein